MAKGRTVDFDTWRKTLDSIIETQEKTVEIILNKFKNAEKEHPELLVPYAKQFYFQKLMDEYMKLLDNKLMRDVAEALKDYYVFVIDENGLPVMISKTMYEGKKNKYGMLYK